MLKGGWHQGLKPVDLQWPLSPLALMLVVEGEGGCSLKETVFFYPDDVTS